MMYERQPAACRELHTHDAEEPTTSYTDWSVWAGEMAKTHTQHRCPSCSLYKVWLPKQSEQNPILSELASRSAS